MQLAENNLLNGLLIHRLNVFITTHQVIYRLIVRCQKCPRKGHTRDDCKLNNRVHEPKRGVNLINNIHDKYDKIISNCKVLLMHLLIRVTIDLGSVLLKHKQIHHYMANQEY